MLAITSDAPRAQRDEARSRRLRRLSIGALGVVYGDIGTSPLYAFRESFSEQRVTPDAANILGILSLIVWSLILVISVKYLVFVLRADNDGEGGILALTALVPRSGDYHGTGRRRPLILIGIFGTALLYGDGMITPAISVLSAVEGLGVATEAFEPLIIPLAIGILVGLFAVQPRGAGAIGAVFGPIMIVWFAVLALLGIAAVIQVPSVLRALSPTYAVQFFVANGFVGLLVLGSVFLVITGGEALYADMGHFGRRPIQIAWFTVVLPGLVLNYLGQGALLLGNPQAVDNPFYRMAPAWATIPLAVLATAATVIASQALISGVFSLSMQAVQMGYLPRLRVQHTSETEEGQVYLGGINWTLMIACIGLVLGFRTSSGLAAAYGVAVTTTMVVTTILFYTVALERFGWSRARALALCGAFLVVDLAFFTGNLFKIPDGGWFPLVVGLAVYTLITTWRRGRWLVANRQRKGLVPVDRFVERLAPDTPRVPGSAYYLTADPAQIPASLLVNLRHNNALHEQIVLLHVHMSGVAHVPAARRARVETLDKGFARVVLRYGFRDRIDVPAALAQKVFHRKGFDDDDVTYVVGHEDVHATSRPGMPLWRERLFMVMNRNASNVTQLFKLPVDRVVELGQPVDI